MSLQVLAQDMASRGRGPDTMLVHMAPKEVAGLQALARANGGTLTTNPSTGLPEAGFLSNILPMVIGAGLMAATGGTAAPLIAGVSNAATIGLGVGALQTARTGSLTKGLQAGLGAYGGAGLTGSLLGAGESALGAANAASPTVGPAAAPVVEAAAPAAAAAPSIPAEYAQFAPTSTNYGAFGEPPIPTAPAAGYQRGMAPVDFVASTPPRAPQPMVGPRGEFLGYEPTATPAASTATAPAAPVTPAAMPVATPAPAAPTAPDLGQYANPRDRFLQQGTVESPAYAREFSLGEKTKAGLEAIGNAPKDFLTKQNLMYAGAAAVPTLMAPPERGPGYKDEANPYRFSYDPNAQSYRSTSGIPTSEQQYFRPTYTRMAGGGPVTRAISQLRGEQTVGGPGTGYAYDQESQEYTRMAKGGISHLGDYSDGGRLLKGPGDGVSDSIPATIANKQPARLADGEFVVPARIVSELGNGSTEAGARKLYAMMDRVQKARGKTVGKGRVAVNSRAHKMLPA